jgi:hypothetical protein
MNDAQSRYNQMIAELQNAKSVAGADIPSEYGDVVSMYSAGGSYGAGQKAIAEEQALAGESQESANLVRTGMSSGSLAAGVRSRYSRNLTTNLQNIEDIRTDKLSAALGALATAKAARTTELAGVYKTSAELIGGGAASNPTLASGDEMANILASQQKSIAAANTEDNAFWNPEPMSTVDKAFLAKARKVQETNPNLFI